jgi:hypothetical protein
VNILGEQDDMMIPMTPVLVAQAQRAAYFAQ